jgi:hypothetical protein
MGGILLTWLNGQECAKKQPLIAYFFLEIGNSRPAGPIQRPDVRQLFVDFEHSATEWPRPMQALF